MLAFSPLIYRDLFHASDVGTMKVNEIANLADVSPDTVRFYNREGLLRWQRPEGAIHRPPLQTGSGVKGAQETS